MRVFLIITLLLFSLHASLAQEAENSMETEPKTSETEEQAKLVSPIGAIVRSVVPGWGQFYGRSYFRGTLTALGVGGSIIGYLLAHKSFKDRYAAYENLIWQGFHNEETVLESYDHANQRYKLRTFFMYTGIGMWLDALIDSYVSANFYNATVQIQSIERDTRNIEKKMGIEIGVTPSYLYLGIVKTF